MDINSISSTDRSNKFNVEKNYNEKSSSRLSQSLRNPPKKNFPEMNYQSIVEKDLKLSRLLNIGIKFLQLEKNESPLIKKENEKSDFQNDKHKEILKRRLKKSAFPAFLAKQKNKKEVFESLGAKRFLESIEEEEKLKISQLKKEKETKRQKALNTFSASNFNLFKSTSIQNAFPNRLWPSGR